MRPSRSGPLLLAALALAALAPSAHAQGEPADDANAPGLRFYGLGRAYIQQADLGGAVREADTTAGTLADGEFVLDLAVNAQPVRTVEVQGTLRLRNEFGGFFGSGATVELRELWARGIVANAIAYRLGDLDLALTPYTVFLPEEDGQVNTPELFVPQKEVIYYEEFYTGLNERRFQGARVDFGLDFDRYVESLEVRAFLTRLRPTDFFNTPTRLFSGGRLGVTSPTFGSYGWQATAGVNAVSTWDDLDSGAIDSGIRNHVLTGDLRLGLYDRPGLGIMLVGEGGRSIAKRDQVLPADTTITRDDDGVVIDTTFNPERVETAFRESDTFIEAGIEVDLKQLGVGLSARFVDVGPDFFSMAAQSKRVDYTRARALFNRFGSDRARRPFGLFDLTRDASVYTFRVDERLMAYDPRYNNALPYGRATPNRRGVRLGAEYAPASELLTAGLGVAFLSEIRGQGTENLRDFVLIRGALDVPVAPLIGYSRGLAVSFGTQFEQTKRDGGEFEAVDLTSLLLEAGITAEVYDRLDVLLGLKTRSSSGRDYVPEYENFNDIRDFPGPFLTDDDEVLMGAGLRYRFREDIYLTVQYQHYKYSDDATPDDDYSVGQVFALYNMFF